MPPARGELWLQEHGDYLYRYALVRVRSSATAEDLVQQTLLAALQAAFDGRASERTWLTGILRNKIIDLLRRTPPTEEIDAWLDGQFDRTGHWRRPPGRWGADPSAELERHEFWEAFEMCRDGLPDRLRIVFSMRFVDEEPAAVVCEALAITSANLWTLLHRARVRLWDCLDGKGLASSRPREKS
ncbi:MAG TPA: sigma-70 family RNA polymerase sigma factor [Gemmataceae bacterium]|jgi:RNA polymerase sigma-70 factor (ECF subfamily)|nr:sigma-70 family RNA polymerase sigma factor [Gemmataceae bacterium]